MQTSSMPSGRHSSMSPDNDGTVATVTTYAASAIGMLSHVDWVFWVGLILLVARLIREIPPAIKQIVRFYRWVRSKL